MRVGTHEASMEIGFSGSEQEEEPERGSAREHRKAQVVGGEGRASCARRGAAGVKKNDLPRVFRGEGGDVLRVNSVCPPPTHAEMIQFYLL